MNVIECNAIECNLKNMRFQCKIYYNNLLAINAIIQAKFKTFNVKINNIFNNKELKFFAIYFLIIAEH